VGLVWLRGARPLRAGGLPTLPPSPWPGALPPVRAIGALATPIVHPAGRVGIPVTAQPGGGRVGVSGARTAFSACIPGRTRYNGRLVVWPRTFPPDSASPTP